MNETKKLERYLHAQNPQTLNRIIHILYSEGEEGRAFVSKQIQEYDKMFKPFSFKELILRRGE